MGDLIGWKDVVVAGGAVLCGLIAFIINVVTKKVDDHIRDDRENFIKLFTGQAQISEKISDGFLCLNKTVSEIHIKLLDRINDVQNSRRRSDDVSN